MDPHSATAVAPLRLLDLPREVRDDIYEAVIFDLSPPDMFMKIDDPDSTQLRKMDTNILLTNRQMYWEARDVIIHRGQLIMVSTSFQDLKTIETCLMHTSGITPIDPIYRNLCIMSHHIDSTYRGEVAQLHEVEKVWGFILHRQDTESFCRDLMGEFNYSVSMRFGFYETHTLNLHCSSTYGQHEFNGVYPAQTLVLQTYRNILRGFENFKIQGPSIGWESGVFRSVLEEIRSNDDREPTELIDDIRTLEQEGSRIMLQTGDVNSANKLWTKALGKCDLALRTWRLSQEGDLLDAPDNPDQQAVKTHAKRWIQLRRRNANDCVIPFIELWYKLVGDRLSGTLHFIEHGHHLASAHGCALRPKDDYSRFASTQFSRLPAIKRSFDFDAWSPQPSDEAQSCATVAAIFRLLNATDKAREAFFALATARALVPGDESAQQELARFLAPWKIWIASSALSPQEERGGTH